MKKCIFIFMLSTFALGVSAQFTKNPNYEKVKPWYRNGDVILSGIVTTRDDTRIGICISGSYSFDGQTYLQYTNPRTGKVEKVYMKDSERVTDGEIAIKASWFGMHTLRLLFPPLPDGVNKIDLIAKRPKVYGISICPVDRTFSVGYY